MEIAIGEGVAAIGLYSSRKTLLRNNNAHGSCVAYCCAVHLIDTLNNIICWNDGAKVEIELFGTRRPIAVRDGGIRNKTGNVRFLIAPSRPFTPIRL